MQLLVKNPVNKNLFSSLFCHYQNWFKSSSKMSGPFFEPEVATKKATFGMGCFWGTEARYAIENGVIHTKVGYIGGVTPNPTYKQISDYTEGTEIDFDPNAISYKQLLDIFWNGHDPRDRYKRQYMSAIFYHDDDQKSQAESTKAEEEKKQGVPMATLILPATTFYDAEDYHQKYRLRGHRQLFKALGLDDEKTISTHIAARLNGWLAGYGDNAQIDKEWEKLGLTKEQAAYVKGVNKTTTPHC
ncbi:Peptide methionine sulfoxide reductase [Halotydeus destructor]|nr:Peptide methionine sulfoxide reductase [Halotydeus destructor]